MKKQYVYVVVQPVMFLSYFRDVFKTRKEAKAYMGKDSRCTILRRRI